MGGQRHNRRSAGGVVVGPGIKHILAEIAEVVVVRRKNVAAVVSAALHLGDDVETLVVFQKLVVNVDRDGFGILREIGGGPDDGLAHHTLAVSLVELQQRRPRLYHPGIVTACHAPYFLKILIVLVREPKVTHHEAVLVLRLGEVAEHLGSIVIVSIYIIECISAVHARRILAHGEIHPRSQCTAVHRHLHFLRKSIDVQLEGLTYHLIGTGLLKLLFQIFTSFVGSTIRIAASLVFCGTQLLDNLFVMVQILCVQLHGGESQEEN